MKYFEKIGIQFFSNIASSEAQLRLRYELSTRSRSNDDELLQLSCTPPRDAGDDVNISFEAFPERSILYCSDSFETSNTSQEGSRLCPKSVQKDFKTKVDG